MKLLWINLWMRLTCFWSWFLLDISGQYCQLNSYCNIEGHVYELMLLKRKKGCPLVGQELYEVLSGVCRCVQNKFISICFSRPTHYKLLKLLEHTQNVVKTVKEHLSFKWRPSIHPFSSIFVWQRLNDFGEDLQVDFILKRKIYSKKNNWQLSVHFLSFK